MCWYTHEPHEIFRNQLMTRLLYNNPLVIIAIIGKPPNVALLIGLNAWINRPAHLARSATLYVHLIALLSPYYRAITALKRSPKVAMTFIMLMGGGTRSPRSRGLRATVHDEPPRHVRWYLYSLSNFRFLIWGIDSKEPLLTYSTLAHFSGNRCLMQSLYLNKKRSSYGSFNVVCLWIRGLGTDRLTAIY